MRTRAPDPRVDQLRDVELFRSCTARELRRIASLVDEIEVPPGRVLAHEGRPGRECFVVTEGTGRVTLRGEELAGIGPGDVFGEMALIDQGPRSATVRTETRMRLLVMDPRGFSTLIAEHPGVARKILQALVERLRDTESPSARAG